MKLLLINKNPVVSRMLRLSAPKAGFEVKECDNVYELPSGEFDIVLIDDEMYDENFLKDVKNSIKYSQIGIITSSKDESFEDMDFTLTKPFLPTDLIELLRGLKSKIEFIEKEEVEKQKDILSLNETLEIEDKRDSENLPENIEDFQKAKEEIVEFEESIEEEPYILEEEIKEKSGVLDESELEKVQELLEEEQKEEKPEILEKLEEFKEEEKKEKKEKPLSSEEKIKALMGALDLYTIRELLDGMEITIKINFSKKKKKKK